MSEGKIEVHLPPVPALKDYVSSGPHPFNTIHRPEWQQAMSAWERALERLARAIESERIG